MSPLEAILLGELGEPKEILESCFALGFGMYCSELSLRQVPLPWEEKARVRSPELGPERQPARLRMSHVLFITHQWICKPYKYLIISCCYLFAPQRSEHWMATAPFPCRATWASLSTKAEVVLSLVSQCLKKTKQFL